ncbi:MAG: SAM-dependent methyltransferase [Rhodospirillaceae bacterium]|nr:SAM-dependent methyltransferase [Rhodospirillaceae bacterium]
MADEIRLTPIGRIRTPFQTLAECPKWPNPDGPPARIELQEQYLPGLLGLTERAGQTTGEIDVLYWFDRAPRDLLISTRPHDGITRGVFAMRSPHRPNPIAVSRVPLFSIDGNVLTVGALDCLDGTLLLDIKPAPRDEPQPH